MDGSNASSPPKSSELFGRSGPSRSGGSSELPELSGASVRAQRPSGVSALLVGDSCRQPPGRLVPAIDRNRCEGKGDCLAVCPYGVFEIGVLPREARSGLSLIGKLKGLAHGWQQAFTPNADACRACGHCVSACPERAITLVRREPRAAGQSWSPPI